MELKFKQKELFFFKEYIIQFTIFIKNKKLHIFKLFLIIILIFRLNGISIIKSIYIFNRNNNIKNEKIINLKDLINKLNIYSKLRTPKYILISDYLNSKYCDDFNGYSLFKFYLEKNITNVYYIINKNTILYESILKQNQTKNIIPIDLEKNIWNDLFNYLLNAKIIIQSYTLYDFFDIINNVSYLKFLHLNHGIRYFKKIIDSYDLKCLIEKKRNIISTSPFEYESLVHKMNYSKNYIYKAGLPKYDRFRNIKKNKSENDCILISFTYRNYNNSVYEKSLLKKNLLSLLNNNLLISILKKNNIDLIYIPHHQDLYRHRNFGQNKYIYAKLKNNSDLTHFIEQCSLFVTDFSSVSFDFMFQSKPTLFYLIDINDTIYFEEKQYMENPKDPIYFGNVFSNEIKLIEKIKFYIDRQFHISDIMKKNYNSVFFYKNNIRERIVKIVNEIINK